MNDNQKTVIALRQFYLRELEGAAVYRALAEAETDPRRKQLLIELAEAEDKHAEKFAARLKELGAEVPPPPDGARQRFNLWFLKQIGTEAAARRVEAFEERQATMMAGFSQSLTEADRRTVLEMEAEEESHARLMRTLSKTAETPQSLLDTIMRRETWHVRGGGWIGQAIYGANDGLGAVFGIVSGVAGATAANSHFVLISGLAGMLASALSMGAGAYLATKSEREVYEAELSREREEIEKDPEEERQELELIYQLKGFSPDEAALLTRKLAEKPGEFLRTLAHEELGLSEASFPDPWRSALSATLSTAAGAFIPIIPFFWLGGLTALIWSFVISVVAHFAIGAAKTIVTGRSWLASGTEMTVVGIAEAAITYGLGLLFGPLIG